MTTNTRLMELNIGNIQRQDDRRIEVIANGLPLWGGVQLAIDTTLVSPLIRAGEPRSRAGRYAGAAVQDARRAKERTYPELLQTRRCKLGVLAIEVGGRWSQETTTFLPLLAQAKARTIPARRKASFTNALIHRWSAQITHAAMTAYAASLLEFDYVANAVTDGTPQPPAASQPAPIRSSGSRVLGCPHLLTIVLQTSCPQQSHGHVSFICVLEFCKDYALVHAFGVHLCWARTVQYRQFVSQPSLCFHPMISTPPSCQ